MGRQYRLMLIELTRSQYMAGSISYGEVMARLKNVGYDENAKRKIVGNWYKPQ